ncbi:MAG: cobalamin biosynthesis protein, partial [Oscillospiraceae bacterium]|nr:cobalamin biosynthesis protein [Oscillospiraceae bacterium]
MNVVFCVLCAFLLDLLLGDPPSLAPVHPVVRMGKAITALEAFLRRLFPKTPGGERLAGAVLAFTLPVGTLLLSAGLLRLSGALWQPLAAALS